MNFNIQKGQTYKTSQTVEFKDTAAHYGSGLVEVFATPAMIALMENTSYLCVQEALGEAFSTVGFLVDVKHIKATPMGQKVYATAELQNIEDKKLTFYVEAHDEEGLIGKGTHIRYIIDKEKFMSKLK